jgi:hypothetical protein
LHPVVYIIVGLIIGLVGLAGTMAFMFIQELENSQGHGIPDNSVHTGETSGNVRIMLNWTVKLNWTGSPIDVSAIGNATGRQYMAIVDRMNVLWAITSEQMGLNAANWTKLMVIGKDPLNATDIELGYLKNGTVGLKLVVGPESHMWALAEWPDSWVPLEGTPYISVPRDADIDREDLPNHERVFTYYTPCRSTMLDGTEIVVCSYSPGFGDNIRHYYPTMIFREAGGRWSNYVILPGVSRETVLHPHIVGTSLTDFFVLYCIEGTNPQWYCNYVTDGTLVEAGTRDLGSS